MNDQNEFIAESADITSKKSWNAPQLECLPIDNTATLAKTNPDSGTGFDS